MKYTFDDVKNIVENKGFVLLSTEYYGHGNKLKFMCTKEHEFEQTLQCFIKSKDCKICSKLKVKKLLIDRSKNKIHSHEYIKNEIEKTGCKLISEYHHCREPLRIICPKNHEFEQSWSNFKAGHECQICSRSMTNLNLTRSELSEDDVKKYLLTFNFILLTKYEKTSKKILIQCNACKDLWDVRLNSFKKTPHCPKCDNIQPNHSVTDIKNILYNRNVELLSEIYTNNKTHLDVKCLICSNIWKATFGCLLQCENCPKCSAIIGGSKIADKLRTDINEVKSILNSYGFMLLSEYRSADRDIELKCDKTHTFITTYRNIRNAPKCPICYPISREEIILKELIEKITGKTFNKIRPDWIRHPITNTRLEIDMYNKDLKLGIEYQGPCHYKVCTFLDMNEDNLLETKFRDKHKKETFDNRQELLIQVPHYLKGNLKIIYIIKSLKNNLIYEELRNKFISHLEKTQPDMLSYID